MAPTTTIALFARAGPYRPTVQMLGETPSTAVDINLSIILLFLYLIAGLMHFAILMYNKKHGHKFLFNGLVFGFAKIRILAYATRDAWASYPDNVSLGVASTFFITAGSFLLLAANLVFAQRIVRAQHPTFGWSKPASAALPIIVALTVLAVVALIIAGLQQAFSTDEYIHYVDHILIQYGSTFLAFIAVLPAIVVLVSSLIGRLPKVRINRTVRPVDKFGQGRMTHNVLIVIASAGILTIGQVFKTVTAYLPATPVDVPGSNPPAPALVPWYLSKAAFYAFNPVPELIVMFMWLFVRIDRRFHVPNKARGSYYAPSTRDAESVKEKAKQSTASIRNSTRYSATTRVQDDSDSTMVLDAFYGGAGGSPETVGGDDRVAGQAAYNIQDVVYSVMKAWEMRREIAELEGPDGEALMSSVPEEPPEVPPKNAGPGPSADAPDVPRSPTFSNFDTESRTLARGRLQEIARWERERAVAGATGSIRTPSSTYSYRLTKHPSVRTSRDALSSKRDRSI